MKLVDNWRALPRMYSVQAMAAIVAIQASSAALEALKAGMLAAPVPLLGITLAEATTGLTTLLALTGIVGRAVAQFTEQ